MLAAQFKELRTRAESCLTTSGSAQKARPFVTAMADTAIPVSTRYRHIPAETIIMENVAGKNQKEVLESLTQLIKTLNVLVKYGCNLTSPNRPQFWRSVKYNNTVFKTEVDTIKGSRNLLCQYGYTKKMLDGLSFPDDVTSPDVQKVAAVTTEIMALATELELLMKGTHSHPVFFERTIPLLQQKQEKDGPEMISDAVVFQVPASKPSLSAEKPHLPCPVPPVPHNPSKCNMCGGKPIFLCHTCGSLPFCKKCDTIVHHHHNKNNHRRDHIMGEKQEKCAICGISPVSFCCFTCSQPLCTECDLLYHSHPDRRGHIRETVNTISPSICQAPCLTTAAADLEVSTSGSIFTEWKCMSCTTVNSSTSVHCKVCEQSLAKQDTSPKTNLLRCTGTEWECQKCTFINLKPGSRCEICDMPQEDPASKNINLLSLLPTKDEVISLKKSQDSSTVLNMKNLGSIREEGLKLLHHLKQGEKKGVGPEEVYAAVQASGGSGIFDWLHSELPHLLEEICAFAASVQLDCQTVHAGMQSGSGEQHSTDILLSKAEARHAWIASEGNTQKAVLQLLHDRAAKLQVLMSMGFMDRLACEKALFVSAGDLGGALSHLQRPLLQPLHKHIWKEQTNIHFDINHDDKQWLCCRLLGVYNLPSWGRCQLALSLLQEPDVEYSLEDVVQAVKEHHDRDFIIRILKKECQLCFGNFPQRKMHSLTSCQCLMCTECFKQNFTVVLRDKHIRDMVCPVCEEPDINDPEVLETYFSTLDVQLRMYLEPDIHELFGNKLMEYTLMKDPKFLWCCHCTSGFINDKDQLKVTCPNCQQSFCSLCKKPWEDQHEGISCNEFQEWKKENDPVYQKQGLAGFLRDNGINCPNCKFQYALAKGGCMHFMCSQCRHEFCCGCNNPFHKKGCMYAQCTVAGLHAHHPRDCLFYLRDWEPARLQALLQMNGLRFNTDPDGTGRETCGVMEQKEGPQLFDAPCGIQTQDGHAGLCDKHYKEYLVSLINGHSLDPAYLFDEVELISACKRHQVNHERGEHEHDETYHARLRQKLMEIPIGDKVPRKM